MTIGQGEFQSRSENRLESLLLSLLLAERPVRQQAATGHWLDRRQSRLSKRHWLLLPVGFQGFLPKSSEADRDGLQPLSPKCDVFVHGAEAARSLDLTSPL